MVEGLLAIVRLDEFLPSLVSVNQPQCAMHPVMQALHKRTRRVSTVSWPRLMHMSIKQTSEAWTARDARTGTRPVYDLLLLLLNGGLA